VTESAPSRDPIEEIAAALARVRGRRGPRPPWDADDDRAGGPHDGRADGHDGAHGGPWAHGGHGGPGMHGRGRGHGFGPGGQDWQQNGLPPWMAAAHGRFGGPARLRLLEALATASESLSVSELAERIGVDQPRASRLVQQAVDMGLVRREADPNDARRTRIVLTDMGSAIIRGFRGDRRGAIEAALSTFTDDERAELARLLTKFAKAWRG
jgi:DNA-binding MarR family transcriptional regulator